MCHQKGLTLSYSYGHRENMQTRNTETSLTPTPAIHCFFHRISQIIHLNPRAEQIFMLFTSNMKLQDMQGNNLNIMDYLLSVNQKTNT